jgi:type I restriction enzyme S subunit
MVREALRERFLEVLKDLGGSAGNGRLRDALGWQEETYWSVQAALIPQGLRCCLGRRMGLLRRHRDRVAPAVLVRAYLSADFQEVIRKHTIHGATVERIPLKDMGDFPIRLPDPNQHPGLADQLTALRDLVEANQSESAMLAATRDLLFPRLMSGELRAKDAEPLVAEVA